jgi:hypothetical protein
MKLSSPCEGAACRKTPVFDGLGDEAISGDRKAMPAALGCSRRLQWRSCFELIVERLNVSQFDAAA